MKVTSLNLILYAGVAILLQDYLIDTGTFESYAQCTPGGVMGVTSPTPEIGDNAIRLTHGTERIRHTIT